jgi:hypothetical protein
MPCDICDHTVQNIGAKGRRIWWCPRCGSLRTKIGEHSQTDVPILVDRVRRARQDTRPLGAIGYMMPTPAWVDVCEAVGREPNSNSKKG